MANKVLIVALACAFIVIAYVEAADSPPADAAKPAAAPGAPTPKASGADMPKYNWKDVKACCNPPDLFTKESRNSCWKAAKAAKASKAAEIPADAPALEAEVADSAKVERGCHPECNAKYLNMVNEKGQLDMAVFEKRMAAIEANNTNWTGIITAALNTCSPTVAPSVKPNQKCTSGANELKNCIVNQMVINCPASVKANTPQCDEIIAQKKAQNDKRIARQLKLSKKTTTVQG